MERIFRVSVVNNAQAGITGALGFSRLTYIQLLEGPPAAIDELMKTLEADLRHRDLVVLLRGPAERRLVPNWAMARVNLAQLAPKVETLVEHGDGLGLIALLATLSHEGLATS